MLNFTAAFWPLFWTIIGSGAVLAIALCWLTAAVTAPHRHQAQPPLPLRPATRHAAPTQAPGAEHAA